MSRGLSAMHVAEAHLQLGRVEVRVPGAHGAVLVVENPHQLDREVPDVTHARVDVRAADLAGRRGLEVAEIRLLAGAGVMLRYVQT
jgi:hypothetical protein